MFHVLTDTTHFYSIAVSLVRLPSLNKCHRACEGLAKHAFPSAMFEIDTAQVQTLAIPTCLSLTSLVIALTTGHSTLVD